MKVRTSRASKRVVVAKTCIHCNREFFATKGHWACPYCGIDNRRGASDNESMIAYKKREMAKLSPNYIK